jgi:hypothetical protein
VFRQNSKKKSSFWPDGGENGREASDSLSRIARLRNPGLSQLNKGIRTEMTELDKTDFNENEEGFGYRNSSRQDSRKCNS